MKLSPRRIKGEIHNITRERLLYSANKERVNLKSAKKSKANSFALDQGNFQTDDKKLKNTSLVDHQMESTNRKIHSSLHNNRLKSLQLYQLKEMSITSNTNRVVHNRQETPLSSRPISKKKSLQSNLFESKLSSVRDLQNQQEDLDNCQEDHKMEIFESDIKNNVDERIILSDENFSNNEVLASNFQKNPFNSASIKNSHNPKSKINDIISTKSKKTQITFYNDPGYNSNNNFNAKIPPRKSPKLAKSFVEQSSKGMTTVKKQTSKIKANDVQVQNPSLNLYEKIQSSSIFNKNPIIRSYTGSGLYLNDDSNKNISFKPTIVPKYSTNPKSWMPSLNKPNDSQPEVFKAKKMKPQQFSIPQAKYHSNHEKDIPNKETEKQTIKNASRPHVSNLQLNLLEDLIQNPRNADPHQRPLSRSVRRNRSLSNKMNDEYMNDKGLKNRNILHGVRTRRGYNTMNLQKKNQDAYFAFPNFMNNELMHLFGVCDGHGNNGEKIADFVSKHFPENLANILRDKADQKMNTEHIANFLLSQNLEMSIFQALEKTVESLTKSEVDSYFSGTTMNAILIVLNNVFVCNVGDSRSVMASGKDFINIIELSEDHKPENEQERRRIISKNGRIEQMKDEDGKPYGPLRVWMMHENLPGLAMTRSIGDMIGASIGITWRPSMVIKKLEPFENAILFVASDGVWEVAENYEVMLECKLFWREKNIEGACDSIMAEILQNWKLRNYDMIDDITFIMIFYG